MISTLICVLLAAGACASEYISASNRSAWTTSGQIKTATGFTCGKPYDTTLLAVFPEAQATVRWRGGVRFELDGFQFAGGNASLQVDAGSNIFTGSLPTNDALACRLFLAQPLTGGEEYEHTMRITNEGKNTTIIFGVEIVHEGDESSSTTGSTTSPSTTSASTTPVPSVSTTTTPSPTPSSPLTSSPPLMAGGGGLSAGAIGGIVIAISVPLVALVAFFLWRRRRLRRGTDGPLTAMDVPPVVDDEPRAQQVMHDPSNPAAEAPTAVGQRDRKLVTLAAAANSLPAASASSGSPQTTTSQVANRAVATEPSRPVMQVLSEMQMQIDHLMQGPTMSTEAPPRYE